MPCRMDDMPSDADLLGQENEFLRKEGDKVTRMLCEVMTEIDEEFSKSGLEPIGRSAELRTWWEKHKAIDEKRKSDEQKLREWAAKARAARKVKKEAKERQEYERLRKKYGKEKK